MKSLHNFSTETSWQKEAPERPQRIQDDSKLLEASFLRNRHKNMAYTCNWDLKNPEEHSTVLTFSPTEALISATF
jgi:hypothetical protein